MNLEKRVEEDGFYYIHSIQHDAENRSFIVELMKAPEEMSPVRRFLIFEGVEEYSEDIDRATAIEEAADGVIDSLIALSEYVHEGKPMYELVTEDRVFNFRADAEPRIEDARPKAI
jgi:hypothetical protein